MAFVYILLLNEAGLREEKKEFYEEICDFTKSFSHDR